MPKVIDLTWNRPGTLFHYAVPFSSLIQWRRLAGSSHATSCLVLVYVAQSYVDASLGPVMLCYCYPCRRLYQASSSLVLGLLSMTVWLAFLIHCDLPELKYFQKAHIDRLHLCVLAIDGIYNLSTTNTLLSLTPRTMLHYLSGFQRKLSVGGQII